MTGRQSTLADFWTDHDVNRVFAVSASAPTGFEYTNEDDEDLYELVFNSLSHNDVSQLTGTVIEHENGTQEWRWDGVEPLRDFRGNNYSRISLFEE